MRTPKEWKTFFKSEQFERTQCYDGDDLGAFYTPEKTVFKVWAPTAEAVILNLYEDGSEGAVPYRQFAMTKTGCGVFKIEIGGDLDGVYYTYTVSSDGRVRETADIYAKACGANGKRSMVVNMARTNPAGWASDKFVRSEKDTVIIYELHIKDFSSDSFGGFCEAYRGKYMAVTERGTVLNNHPEFSTGLDYVKALGVTHVHLLPVFDYASVDETSADMSLFNWGYDPENYNVPEGSYATDSLDGAVRIYEFKKMVQAFHDAGIGVIMDVVYNHTYDRDGSFQKTVPYYYYRTDENGNFCDGSCCGNDTASERKMFRKYMTDSVCYWAKEYHIDGFRFDLMGLHDVETMNGIREALDNMPDGRQKLMYGEPWAAGRTVMRRGAVAAVKSNVHLLNERIGFFNDDTRDAIKGSVFFEEDGGYINGRPENAGKIRAAVTAWCGGEAGYRPHNPGQVISYVSAHDNFTLWDKLVYTAGDGISFDRENPTLLAMNRMAAGIVFTCQGHVFFQAGEEFARTKQGIGDSYNKPPSVNQLDWRRAYDYRSLIDYYKGLIAIRKQFSGFKNQGFAVPVTFYENKTASVVSFVINAEGQRLFAAYNPEKERQLIHVPKGQWQMLSDGERIFYSGTGAPVDEYFCAEPLSVTILGENIHI